MNVINTTSHFHTRGKEQQKARLKKKLTWNFNQIRNPHGVWCRILKTPDILKTPLCSEKVLQIVLDELWMLCLKISAHNGKLAWPQYNVGGKNCLQIFFLEIPKTDNGDVHSWKLGKKCLTVWICCNLNTSSRQSSTF